MLVVTFPTMLSFVFRLVMVFLLVVLLFAIIPPLVQAQSTTTISPKIGVKITSLKANQTVPTGELTIYGTSSDTVATNCRVYADWNDLKPMQNVTAAGPGGQTDYSNWTFTYTRDYHLITEGTNELTSKISCISRTDSANNLTKYYSVNVTGSSNPSLTSPTKSFSSSDGTGNGTYIEITTEYSNSNKHDNNNPKIEIRSSSSMISTNGKLKAGENTSSLNLEQGHSDLSKYIHNIIKERIDKIRD
jgi:hypothetical protein